MKNFKRNAFCVLMCAIMAVSSLAVLAGGASTNFGAGDESGTASLGCYATYARAVTTPTHSGVSCSTSVTIYGTGSYSSSGTEVAYVDYMHSDSASHARSTHRIGSFYTTLTAYA